MPYKNIFRVLLSVFWICTSPVFAQEQKIADSLAAIYQQSDLTDTAALELLKDLSFNELKDLEQGLAYAEKLITLAEQTGNNNFLRRGYFLKGNKERALGNLDLALGSYFKSAEIARKLKQLKAEGESYGAIADIYSMGNNHSNAITYYNKAISILRQTKDSVSLASYLLNAGDEFRKTKSYKSALLYSEEAKSIFDKVNYRSGQGYSLGNIGMVYASIGRNTLAEKYMNEGIRILQAMQDYHPICDYLISMADVYMYKGDHQAAMHYALKSLQLAEQYGLKEQVGQASLKLSELYEKNGDTGESYAYYKRYILNRDSINNLKTVQQMADLRTDYEVSQKQAEVNILSEQKRKDRYLMIALGTILGLTIVILFILFKSIQHRRKAYKILTLQKEEIARQKAMAEEALNELQITQKQLIQAAKMASLGELTAGIAHEIQNPLNFVNNFAEVTAELLCDLRVELVSKLADSDKAEAEALITNLAENLEKIGNHGKRADSIVKGMLQHSRSGTGKKEQTDFNALAVEYLRLSYHGFQAKDEGFSVQFSSELDRGIGKLDILPQEVGRVLLNLYNNAFYAVSQKEKLCLAGYEPHVCVKTKRLAHYVQLSVRDNGTGIPEKVLDKIFQPFFTTKPAGQGTGLGLSLSYDIIKAHGGDIKVETKEGEFTEFIVELPIAGHKRV